jgi:hypothetical protein
VPDFDLILAIYEHFGRDMAAIAQPLMGGQNYPANFHKAAFTKGYLGAAMTEAGFSTVQEWIPGSSPMTTFPDWSGRRIQVRGETFPISLNLEGTKPGV